MSRQTVRHFIIGLLCCLCANASASNSSGWQEDSILINGQSRHYRAYLPGLLPPNPPVVIFLHGGTQSMRKIFRRYAGATLAWPELADINGFILLVPNGVNTRNGDAKGNRQNWNDCRSLFKHAGSPAIPDDVGFIEALIGQAVRKYAIDRNRVYLSGVSNGGMMTYRLASELGNQIAAAVFVANQPVSDECTQSDVPVPIMIMNGTQDPLMPWAGGQVAGKKGAVKSATMRCRAGYRINSPGHKTGILMG